MNKILNIFIAILCIMNIILLLFSPFSWFFTLILIIFSLTFVVLLSGLKYLILFLSEIERKLDDLRFK